MGKDVYRSDGWRQLNLAIRPRDDRRIRKLAQERGLSLSALLREMIDRAEEKIAEKTPVRQ